MATRQMNFPLPPYGPASLTLPELLTPDAFARRLDAAIGAALSEPRRNGSADAANDPGAIEFDSWLIHLN